jgi:hypothetical protein
MYELKKIERYLRVNLLGPGLRLLKKIIYWAAVSQKVKKHCPRQSTFYKEYGATSKKPDTMTTGKSKVVPKHAVKTYKGSRGIAPFIRNLGTM